MRTCCTAIGLFLSTLVLVPYATSDEPKYHDSDVIYDEAKVPPYDLPPLLVTSEGKRITTPDEWFHVRRPQIMAMFGTFVYGVVPEPESPLRTTFEVVKTDREFMDGLATRKDVRIRFENAKGSAEMQILVFTPQGTDGPVPAFMWHSFGNTRDDGHDANPERPGFLRNGLPLGEILRRGFGFVVVPQGDLVRHNEVEFLSGIHPLYYRTGQSFPKAYEWGVISTVAWGASRAFCQRGTFSDTLPSWWFSFLLQRAARRTPPSRGEPPSSISTIQGTISCGLKVRAFESVDVVLCAKRFGDSVFERQDLNRSLLCWSHKASAL